MNTLRMGVIAICSAVGASGYWSLRGAATEEAQAAQATRMQTANVAAGNQALIRNTEHAERALALKTAAEPALESDTSEVLQPSRTIDEILEAVNADIGPEGQYVDREALGAVLHSDSKLDRIPHE